MRNNGSEGDTAKLEIKEKLTSGIRLSCEMLKRRVRIGNLYTLMDDAGRTEEKKEWRVTEQLAVSNRVKARGKKELTGSLSACSYARTKRWVESES